MTLHCLWMYINDIALSMDVYKWTLTLHCLWMYINDIALSMDVYK